MFSHFCDFTVISNKIPLLNGEWKMHETIYSILKMDWVNN